MSFCRSSFLNDSTTIFVVFQVLEVPWKTINPPNLITIITLKLCIDKILSKVRFVSKNGVSSPLKLHPKSLKIELGSPRKSSWRSEGPAELFKASIGSQKVVAKSAYAQFPYFSVSTNPAALAPSQQPAASSQQPASQPASQPAISQLPKGPAAGAKPLDNQTSQN